MLEAAVGEREREISVRLDRGPREIKKIKRTYADKTTLWICAPIRWLRMAMRLEVMDGLDLFKFGYGTATGSGVMVMVLASSSTTTTRDRG